MSIKDFLSGSLAGVAQVGVGYPFDTIKVRMQYSNQYKNAIHCLKDTLKEGGVRSLYRGIAYPMIGSVAFNSFSFGLYTNSMKYLKNNRVIHNKHWSDAYLCGVLVGGVATAIEAPRDLLKSQSQRPNTPYNDSVFSAFRNIYPKYGMRGIFKGTNATFVRNVLTTPFFYGFYDSVKDVTNNYVGQKDSLIGSALGGAVGGFGIWGILYPLDVVKTRIQLDEFSKSKQNYHGIIDTFKKMYKTEGMRSFFRGYGPCIVRAVPVNACVFVAFDIVNNFLKGDSDEQI